MSDAADEHGLSAEELRRRLYDADATDQDRARYRAAIEAATERPSVPPAAEPPAEPSAGQPAPAGPETGPRRRRRSLTILAVVVGAAVILAAVIALQPRTAAIPVDPPPSPSTITVDQAARDDFLQNLGSGGSAGIAAFLVTHHIDSSLGAATRLFLLERHGRGPGSVTLEGVPREAEQGHATVFLVTQFAGPAGWSAYRDRPGGQARNAVEPDASRAGAQEGGVPTMATFAYRPGDRPVRLHVDVPDGVRWGVAVAFSN